MYITIIITQTGIFITAFWWFFAACVGAMVIGFIIKAGINKFMKVSPEMRQLYIAMDTYSVTRYVLDGTLAIGDGERGIGYHRKIAKSMLNGRHMDPSDRGVALADVEKNYQILKNYIDYIQNATTEEDIAVREEIKKLIQKRAEKFCIIL